MNHHPETAGAMNAAPAPDPGPPIVRRPAFTSMIQLAAEARGDDWANDLSGALTAAATAGWSWERAFLAAAKLIIDPDASARDLLRQVQDPTERTPSDPPNEAWAAARAALAARPRREQATGPAGETPGPLQTGDAA